MMVTSKREAPSGGAHQGTASTSTVRRRILHRLGLPVLLLAGGCMPPAVGNDSGPGHRSQRLALTPEQELALGRQAYQEVLSKAHVVRSGPEVERVRRIGRRIADAAAIEPLQREINLHLRGYRFEWEF